MWGQWTLSDVTSILEHLIGSVRASGGLSFLPLQGDLPHSWISEQPLWTRLFAKCSDMQLQWEINLCCFKLLRFEGWLSPEHDPICPMTSWGAPQIHSEPNRSHLKVLVNKLYIARDPALVSNDRKFPSNKFPEEMIGPIYSCSSESVISPFEISKWSLWNQGRWVCSESKEQETIPFDSDLKFSTLSSHLQRWELMRSVDLVSLPVFP